MAFDHDSLSSILKDALSSHIDTLIKSTATNSSAEHHIEPAHEEEHDKAVKEEKAFDEPSVDEHEEIQDLAYWSLEYRRQSDLLILQKSKEEIVRITCENDDLRAKTRNNHALARGRKIDNRLRLQMADATFKFMLWWCGFVALIVFIYIAKNEGNPPPEVIIALLGTSTISIVGLVGFVVSGLFKSNKDKYKDTD